MKDCLTTVISAQLPRYVDASQRYQGQPANVSQLVSETQRELTSFISLTIEFNFSSSSSNSFNCVMVKELNLSVNSAICPMMVLVYRSVWLQFFRLKTDKCLDHKPEIGTISGKSEGSVEIMKMIVEFLMQLAGNFFNQHYLYFYASSLFLKNVSEKPMTLLGCLHAKG